MGAGWRGDHVREFNLPHHQQEAQRRHQVVALVVQQVVDDAVVPAFQVAHIGRSEPGRAREKIIQTAKRWRLHACHLSASNDKLNVPEYAAGIRGVSEGDNYFAGSTTIIQ